MSDSDKLTIGKLYGEPGDWLGWKTKFRSYLEEEKLPTFLLTGGFRPKGEDESKGNTAETAAKCGLSRTICSSPR